jgi:IS5 family transposase
MPHIVREAPLREEKREVNKSPGAMKAANEKSFMQLHANLMNCFL